MSIVKDTFKDYRRMEEVGVDTFKTEDNEIVITKIQIGDFTPKALAEYTVLCEDAYEKYNTKINLYIIMDPLAKVTVKQMEIKSKADFTIKLALSNEDPIEKMIKLIGEKITNGTATQEDYEALKMIPVNCKKEDRLYYRQKTLEMLNMVE